MYLLSNALVIGSSEGIWVHAVFVSNFAGEILKRHARAEEGECCIISSLKETAWTVLVISFISLLMMVSVLASFFLIRNCWRNQRGTSRLVDSKVVEVLPCFTFCSAHQSGYILETCTICLEDYKDGENLRVLPCHHGRIFFFLLNLSISLLFFLKKKQILSSWNTSRICLVEGHIWSA